MNTKSLSRALSLRTKDAVNDPADERSDVQTIGDFLAREFRPKRPLVKGLIHQRDLVLLGARRRHGKTTFLIQLAVDLAVGATKFLGYDIPEPRRTLLFLLEDDPLELREKIRQQLAGRSHEDRIAIYTRDDFNERGIAIEVGNSRPSHFQRFVEAIARDFKPDLIVFDNLGQIIGADYSNSILIHKFAMFARDLAKSTDAAIVTAAHPKKDNNHLDKRSRVTLDGEDDGTTFFESIMGSSHLINSMGNLWGLERLDDERTIFLGGRQRAEGHQQRAYLELDDDGQFQLVSDADANLPKLLNTEGRQRAWKLLPPSFSFGEGRSFTNSVLKSKNTFNYWLRECVRLGVLTKSGAQYVKSSTAAVALRTGRQAEP